MNELGNKNRQLPAEQQAIRDKCFHPLRAFVSFPLADVETSIPQRFEKIARLHPERLAVKHGKREFAYEELNRLANGVARAIARECGASRQPVALLFGQSSSAIAAMLGALKAAKTYVPLLSSLPLSRSLEIVSDSTARLVITDSEHFAAAQSLVTDECRVMNIDKIALDLPPEDGPQLFHHPDDIAYLVYTSGSTGRPKGVMHNHRHVLYHAFDYAESFHISCHDRVSLLPPWSFNGAAHIIFSTLLHGAALFPLDVQAEGVDNLTRLLVDEKITIHHSSGALLRQVVSSVGAAERLQALRLIRFGGDAVTEADVDLARNNFARECLVVNSLSATETGIISRCFFDRESSVIDRNVPVGFVAPGKEIHILDDDGNPAGADQAGEIAVKSRYLSPGYWRRPDLTAAKFLPSPDGGDERIYLTGDVGRMTADGCLYHLGRKDFQVKIRGHRIEAGEVETVLLQHPAIEQAVVVGREDRQAGLQLAAYVIGTGKVAPGISELQEFVRQKLPAYMIPTAIVFLDVFPLTATGKIDRRRLPDPQTCGPASAAPYVAPRTSVERDLAGIWAEVLSLDRVGIDEKFLELGGHSLAAMRVVSRVLQTFRIDLPVKALLDSASVADMARVITACLTKMAKPEELEQMLGEVEAMSEEEAQKMLAASRVPNGSADEQE